MLAGIPLQPVWFDEEQYRGTAQAQLLQCLRRTLADITDRVPQVLWIWRVNVKLLTSAVNLRRRFMWIAM